MCLKRSAILSNTLAPRRKYIYFFGGFDVYGVCMYGYKYVASVYNT